jgi:hypothetical protein
MLKRLRKSSGSVTLVLIGVATLAGCGEDEHRRDVYKSKADCLADWGNKPEDCTPATEARHAGSGFFYGPLYGYAAGRAFGSGWGWSSGSSTRSGSHAIGSTAPTRGGFGSSGHSSAG